MVDQALIVGKIGGGEAQSARHLALALVCNLISDSHPMSPKAMIQNTKEPKREFFSRECHDLKNPPKFCGQFILYHWKPLEKYLNKMDVKISIIYFRVECVFNFGTKVHVGIAQRVGHLAMALAFHMPSKSIATQRAWKWAPNEPKSEHQTHLTHKTSKRESFNT